MTPCPALEGIASGIPAGSEFSDAAVPGGWPRVAAVQYNRVFREGWAGLVREVDPQKWIRKIDPQR